MDKLPFQVALRVAVWQEASSAQSGLKEAEKESQSCAGLNSLEYDPSFPLWRADVQMPQRSRVETENEV